jgi:ATP-dependent protease ClpP protease subunit
VNLSAYERAESRARPLWENNPAIRYAFVDLGSFTQTLIREPEAAVHASEADLLMQRYVTGTERLALVRDPAFAHTQQHPLERDGSRLVVWIYGPLTHDMAIADRIAEAIENAKTAITLVFRISSHGGSVPALVRIQRAVMRFRGRSIAIVDHFAISAAADIACSCDRLVMRDNAVMKVHRSTANLTGNEQDLTEAANNLRNSDWQIARIAASKRRITLDALNELIRADRYVGAREALALGLCDAITRPLSGSDTIIEKECGDHETER